MFQSNDLSSVYIDEYILIPGQCWIIIFKISTLKALIITETDNILCNNFLLFWAQKQK